MDSIREAQVSRTIRKIFEKLAAEEHGHEKMLRNLYHDYKKQLGFKVLQPEDDA